LWSLGSFWGGGEGAGFSVSLRALAVGGAPSVRLSIRVWPGFSYRRPATLLLASNRSHPASSCVQTPTSLPLIGLGFGTGYYQHAKKFWGAKEALGLYYHGVLVIIFMVLCLWAYSMVIVRNSSSISDLAAHSTQINPSEVRGFHLDQSGLQNVHWIVYCTIAV